MLNNKHILRIIALLLLIILLGGVYKAQAQILTDRDFFKVVNLDFPGLEKVKRSVEGNDLSAAKKQFVDYLKQREKPVWYFDWRANDHTKRKTGVNISEANRFANNELLSCGIWHKFGTIVKWTYDASDNNYNEWTWQLNRHYAWVTLGKAYWNTGNEKYAKAFVSQLNSWLNQCIKPADSGYGVGSPWRTLEVGIRMMNCWPNAFYFFLSSSTFDDETIIKMVKSFYEHGCHLRVHNSRVNWLSIEMNGLYTVGALFPEFKEAEEWRSFAAEKLYQEEKEQFYPDGSQIELATGYHGNSLSSIVSVYRLAQLNNYQLPKDYVSRLEKAYEYFQKIMMPDGKLPALNDSGWEECRDYLIEATELFPCRKDFAYGASRGLLGKKPSYTSTWMPWAGWYVMRSGWDENALYSIFEVGPYGADHQHEDKLSFVLYGYGSRLITECGNYAYDNSQWRKYAVSARGHNVVRVDSMDQNRNKLKKEENVSVIKSPLTNSWVSKEKRTIGVGSYDEGFGDNNDKTVRHCRTLELVNNRYWVLTDEFIPSDDKEHTYESWFHLNTDKFRVDTLNNVIYSLSENEANIAIIRLSDNHEMKVIVGQQNPELQGWVAERSSDNGFSCRPVATPVYYRKGSGIVRETFVFVPIIKGGKIEIISIKKVSRDKVRLLFDRIPSISINLN